MATLDIRGQIAVSDGCGCSPCGNGYGGAGAAAKVQPFMLACNGQNYQQVVSTDVPFPVDTQGEWRRLPLLDQIDNIEFLYLWSNSTLDWRFNGTVPTLVGGQNGNTPVAYPITFPGAVDLGIQVTNVGSANVTFQAGTYTAEELANEIDSQFALAGIVQRPGYVSGGQLALRGFNTGRETVVAVVGGSAQIPLGFAPPNDQAVGGGNDVRLNGMGLFEFGRANPVNTVEVRGFASQVTVLAAGSAA